MRAAAAVLLAALALLPADPAAAQRASGVPAATLYSEDGYDIDAILRRSRELDAGRERSGPPDDRRHDAWSRARATTRERTFEAVRERERATRDRFQAELRRQTLESMRPPSQQPAIGDRILDAERLDRLRNESERARREADDAIPLLWRQRP